MQNLEKLLTSLVILIFMMLIIVFSVMSGLAFFRVEAVAAKQTREAIGLAKGFNSLSARVANNERALVANQGKVKAEKAAPQPVTAKKKEKK